MHRNQNTSIAYPVRTHDNVRPRVQRSLSDAVVLLTGATGLIGGEILRRLLECDVAQIYCIVRESAEIGMKRVKARLCSRVPEAKIDSGVTIVSGDFTKCQLGIAPEMQAELKRTIDTIIHCAAITSFLQKKQCWDVNFEGTRQLLDLCRGFERQLTFFHFGSSSTCGVVSDAVLGEEDFPFAGNAYFAPYAASKAAVELDLFPAETDLDIVVLRPSMVVPTGPLPDGMLREVAWSLALMQQCSALPINPQAFVDIVPLDFVGDYTMRVVQADRHHRRYHLTAGIDGSSTMCSMLAIVSESFGERPIRLLQGEEWRRHADSMSRREKVMIRQISSYFPFINQSVIFDNSRLFEECGPERAESFDLTHHLPDIIRSLSVSEALRQSRRD